MLFFVERGLKQFRELWALCICGIGGGFGFDFDFFVHDFLSIRFIRAKLQVINHEVGESRKLIWDVLEVT